MSQLFTVLQRKTPAVEETLQKIRTPYAGSHHQATITAIRNTGHLVCSLDLDSSIIVFGTEAPVIRESMVALGQHKQFKRREIMLSNDRRELYSHSRHEAEFIICHMPAEAGLRAWAPALRHFASNECKLIIEMQWLEGDMCWRDVAQRCSNLALGCNLRLESVNGIDVCGDELQRTQLSASNVANLRYQYTRLAKFLDAANYPEYNDFTDLIRTRTSKILDEDLQDGDYQILPVGERLWGTFSKLPDARS